MFLHNKVLINQGLLKKANLLLQQVHLFKQFLCSFKSNIATSLIAREQLLSICAVA